MSKSKHNKFNDYNWSDEEEYVSSSQLRQEKKEKRRQKRLNAALKTKDINKLLEYEEDYD